MLKKVHRDRTDQVTRIGPLGVGGGGDRNPGGTAEACVRKQNGGGGGQRKRVSWKGCRSWAKLLEVRKPRVRRGAGGEVGALLPFSLKV